MSSNCVSTGSLTTLPHVVMFLCFSGVAIYNSLELFITIFMAFKRRATLYFYSVLVATFGVLLYAVAVFLLVLELTNGYISTSLVDVGWSCMVTGQSLVLYSRLHLLVRDSWKLNWILGMIIVDGIVFHSIMFGLSLKGVEYNLASSIFHPFVIMEKVIATLFFVQEMILSGTYLYYTRMMLKPGEAFQKHRFCEVMLHLIYANILIITLDIILLSLEYTAIWGIWCSFKGVVYSTKLKMEFNILNQLKSLTTGNSLGQTYLNTRNTLHGEVLHTIDHCSIPGDDSWKSAVRNNNMHTECFKQREGLSQNQIVDDGCILKTTQIEIQDDKLHRGAGDGDSDRRYGNLPTTLSVAKMGGPGSKASSEVEFAAHGA